GLLSLISYAAPSHQAFDANGTTNMVVYFSQSSGKSASLASTCADPSVDMVVLGFIRSFNGTAGYPTLDMGPTFCPGRRPSNETTAPGLAVCPQLAQQIQGCQDQGKKVMLSIGGSTSNTTFDSNDDGRSARDAAAQLWNLFGEGNAETELRPFGNVTVDGFDIDNEVGSSDNYDVFTSAMRDYFNTASKPMYMSAAPLCQMSNKTISMDTLALVDFIFVRFYNAQKCSLGTRGWTASLQQWYNALPNPASSFPKFYLTGLSFDNGNTGYVSAEDFASAVDFAMRPDLMKFNAAKFGGVTLWD
ncbi:glycoside hydrolase family 18 protein, partial [Saccharata proteae CBS 121410]